jgi:hypothetical protein
VEERQRRLDMADAREEAEERMRVGGAAAAVLPMGAGRPEVDMIVVSD